MRKYFLILSIFLITCIVCGFHPIRSSLAIVTKTIKSVAKKNPSSDWIEISKGEILVGGDQLKTGKNSLAIIKFSDNSIIRVREQSQLTINSEGQKGSMIKTTHLTGGGVGFDIKKQQNEQFQLTSPTSVASIRGTKGKWSGGRGHDTLIVIEGIVNLRNLISNKDIDIVAGFIGFSNEDGSLSSRKANENEIEDANMALSDGTTNELKLEMKDSKGNKKELKIRYKK